MDAAADWLEDVIVAIADWFPPDTYLNQPFNVRSLLAILLVSLVCGAVGSLVVGNRMAFFSDALSHCAFAGVSLGLLIAYLTNVLRHARVEESFYSLGIPLIMVGFGVLVGLGIVFVREKTGLASDTVIGVFFAGALGFGAMILQTLSRRKYFNPESFLFGDVGSVNNKDLLVLAGLVLLTALVMGWMYNRLVFTSVNASLARSRRVPVRLCSYLFVALLGVIINLCLKAVGALLINALLIVPAATAANLCRNLRQLFWTTVGLVLAAGVLGPWLSWELALPDPDDPGKRINFGIGGCIVVLSVLLFFASVPLGRLTRGRQAA